MKIVIVGASGTVGSNAVEALSGQGHELIRVGRKSGDVQVDIDDPRSIEAMFKKIGGFDALANASGDVAFAPLQQLGQEQWELSLKSKFMGQVNLVRLGLPYAADGGSFTLISGILTEEPILAGVAASAIDAAIEGYAMAAAAELPRGIRINVVSPTVLEESVPKYGPFFPGFIPVAGAKVGQAYKKAILGVQTGKVFKVF